MAHSPIKSPSVRAHMALDPLQHVSVDDLAAGTGEWSNLQKVIRVTFKRIIDTSQLQGKELEMLREYSRHLGHCMGSKLDKRAVDELAERVRQNSSSILTLQAQVQSARHESQQALQDTRKELEAAVEAKGSMAALNQALDARVERTELSRFRAEVDSRLEVLSALDQRLRDVEGRVRVAEGRLSTNPSPVMEAVGGRGTAHEAVVALNRRVELMQSELCRLARNLDAKADAQEVAEALKAKVSKPSLQKRLDALAEESHETSEALRPLEANVDAATNAAEEALRKVAAHDDAIKRIKEEVDASSRATRASAPEPASVKTVETLAQQTVKKVQRMEKDLVGLGNKVVAMQEDVQQRPTMLDLDNLKRAVSDHNKGMHDDILKTMETHERSLNRELAGSKHAVAQLESRLEGQETSLSTRLTKVEDTLSSLPDRGADERSALRKRIAAVESRLELLTPERIEIVVTTALRRAGAGAGVDQLFGSIGSAAESSSSSSSFSKLLRRLNDVDLTTADGRRLCKALQEVLRDVLGTLEQHLSLQMTELAEAGDRQHEHLACRMSECEEKVERACHGRLKDSAAEDNARILRHGDYREDARPSRRRARPWESQQSQGGADDELEGHGSGTVTLDDALARRRRRSGKAGSGGGGDGAGVGALTAKEWEGFREIVLRRLDFVEQEVERLEEVKLHKHDDPWVRRQEVEDAMGALQDQLTDLSKMLLNLRPDNARDLTQLQSTIHAVEMRLEQTTQTVKAVAESKGALEAEVERLRQEHGQLRVALTQALQGDAKDQGSREAVRNLEEQVLECREQISTRVSALRQRFESPLEQFGERMHVITEDLREIKKKLNRPKSAWDAVGSTSSDRNAPGHALLQSRISEVEGVTRHLGDRLTFVTGDVDRVKAISPLPGSPSLLHDARPPFHSQHGHRSRSLTVEQLQEEMPRKGVSSPWQGGGGMDPEAPHSRRGSTGAEATAAARHSRVSSTSSSLFGGTYVSRLEPQPFGASEVHERLDLHDAAGGSSQRRGSWPVELPHRSRADRLSLQDGSQGVGNVTAEQSTGLSARRNEDGMQAFTSRRDSDVPDRIGRETDVKGRRYEAGVHDDSDRGSESRRGMEAGSAESLRGLFPRCDTDVQQPPEQQLDALRREKELLKSRLNLGL